MDIAIVKYNAGNIRSVLFALERIGASAIVTDDPESLQKADRVIFPGVGEAGSAMRYLKERKLDQLIAGDHCAGPPARSAPSGPSMLTISRNCPQGAFR